MAVEVQVEGLDDVVARLKALPAALSRGPIRKALFAPAKQMRDMVKATVPVWKGPSNRWATVGLLRDSIGVFRDRHPEQKGAAEVYYIGTRKLRKAYADTARNRRYRRVGKKYTVSGAAFYVMFVEFGSSTTGLGRPGQAAQRPFTRTFEAQKYSAVTTFANQLAPQIDATVNKLAKMSASQL
jgi:HK97 gp10 family phage protein